MSAKASRDVQAKTMSQEIFFPTPQPLLSCGEVVCLFSTGLSTGGITLPCTFRFTFFFVIMLHCLRLIIQLGGDAAYMFFSALSANKASTENREIIINADVIIFDIVPKLVRDNDNCFHTSCLSQFWSHL